MPGSTAYPGALDDDTNLPDDNANEDTSEDLHPELHNNSNAAIRAIQTELGTTPSGAEDDVAARLDAIEGSLSVSTLSLASDATPVVGTSFANAASGLNIAVTNGVPVRFYYLIAFVTNNGTTTGARFGLNGPSATRFFSRLTYTSNSSGGILTPVAITSYDATGPTLGQSADATNNLCILEGILLPSASGTLALRVMAELADPGSVTVKAGSSVLYW